MHKVNWELSFLKKYRSRTNKSSLRGYYYCLYKFILLLTLYISLSTFQKNVNIQEIVTEYSQNIGNDGALWKYSGDSWTDNAQT